MKLIKFNQIQRFEKTNVPDFIVVAGIQIDGVNHYGSYEI